jgi:hypothetical protein
MKETMASEFVYLQEKSITTIMVDSAGLVLGLCHLVSCKQTGIYHVKEHQFIETEWDKYSFCKSTNFLRDRIESVFPCFVGVFAGSF